MGVSLAAPAALAESSDDNYIRQWKAKRQKAAKQNAVKVDKAWWDTVGNPAIHEFRDCMVNSARRNFGADKSLEQVVTQSVPQCQAAYDHMLAALRLAYRDDDRLNAALEKIVGNIVGPAVAGAYEELEYSARVEAEAVEKRKGEIEKAAFGCINPTLERYALSTGEAAEIVALGVMSACWKEIDTYLDMTVLQSSRRNGAPPPSPSELAEMKRKLREDYLKPALVTQVLEVRVAARNGGQGPQTPPGSSKAGTGFFVSAEGHILTNEHVVRGCSAVDIYDADKRKLQGTVQRVDGRNDLAVIRTYLKPPATAKFRSVGTLRPGEDVVVFGYPLPDVLSSGGNVVAGSLTALTGYRDDQAMVQFSAPIQHGNSGGPLLNRQGHVIGVVVGKLNLLPDGADGLDVPQNVNFAIKDWVSQEFLGASGVRFETAAAGPELDVPSVAETAKAFTVQVVCTPQLAGNQQN